MQRGKKSVAEGIVYDAMEIIERNQRRKPGRILRAGNAPPSTPVLEVKPRRVGGATYQVPVEIKGAPAERRSQCAG